MCPRQLLIISIVATSICAAKIYVRPQVDSTSRKLGEYWNLVRLTTNITIKGVKNIDYGK